MSKESAENKIHEAVEEAIDNNISVKEFIKMASISWSEVLQRKDHYDSDSFKKLLAVNGVY